ncbi:MAG: response regulator [Candidatus Bathyarchaeota archaeon]|nr:response regulator [Candidatus Bathyarchaeota archaeon]
MVLDKPNSRILVVDDDRTILNVFSRIFERNGYSVTGAESAKEAEEKLGNQDYDAVLVDVRLSGMNRVDFAVANASEGATNGENCDNWLAHL